jgi:small-conductance mechanosensitive channel
MRAKNLRLFICIGLVFLLTATAAWSKNPMLFKTSKAKPAAKPAETLLPPQPLTPEKVDAYLAGLTDAQARQVLAQKLKQEATAAKPASTEGEPGEGREGGLGPAFSRSAQKASALLERAGSVFSGASEESDRWQAAVDKLSGSKGGLQLFLSLGGAALLIGCGLISRRLFTRATARLNKQILNTVRLGKLEVFGRIFSRALLNALGIGVYMLTTFILFVLVYREATPGYSIASAYLVLSYYLLLIAFAADIIFSPAAASLRLFPLPDVDAAFLYRWILRIATAAGIIAATAAILDQAGIGEQLYQMIYSAAGAVVILALLIMIFKSRQRVAQAILSEDHQEHAQRQPLRNAFGRYWHIFAILYVLIAGGYWITDVFLEGRVSVLNLIISVFLIPIFIGVDQWGQRLLKLASGELPEIIDLSAEDKPPEAQEGPVEKKTDIKRYALLIRKLFRIMLVAFLFFIVLRLWGIDLSIGRIFTRHVLGIIIVLLIGFMVWEYTKARIDSKLKEEMPDQDHDLEEGGKGGSRSGTLLLLLRKFILATLFVVVSLSILSSLGVNIGPLIAGAGVVGLAIGFGAQTLVKDIIAGVFFLIDDAFRVGDYVEAGTAKGMVERISLRSMKLRHPRGMVYTLPFGDIKLLTNFSRDYTIMKLDIRVRYDADLDKIRKIVKKINKELRKDEAINRVMLDDLKSQGVRELDDSAMIVRVKFKTLPGEQFVIRREVYRMIQEEFRANGIEFAHRNVTVYLPPEAPAGGSAEGEKPAAADENLLRQAGAAAALAAIQEEEEAKKKKEK